MRVTVFGSARILEGSDGYAEAFELGRLLAHRGDQLVSGGYGGVMEAASRGAHESGGSVVGVTVAPWIGRIAPNPYLSEEISAQTLFERLEALVESDAMIALSGGAGTLLEVALAWNLQQMGLMAAKPVILVGAAWAQLLAAFADDLIVDERDLRLLTHVATIEEAVVALDEIGEQESRWLG